MLGWREVPVAPDTADVGPSARSVMPHFAMLFVTGIPGSDGTVPAGIELDRLTFCLRKRAERESAVAGCGMYFPSLSARTLVYKGMLTTGQLPAFFADLTDERLLSAIALVHSRFSTNTFPSLAAGPPVPLRGAQRRDQHDPGQPQPDARPRGTAGVRPDSR